MIHPAWQELLPRLRRLMDERGLSHIAINENSEGEPYSMEDLIEIYDSPNVYFDEWVSFEPIDPDWRIYRVEGGPENEWIGRAHITDFQNTPSIKLAGSGQWEMYFSYDQGLLPSDYFDDETVFLTTLVDHLADNFTDQVFTLGVSIYPEGCSWGRK
jgi:hypothetical protein